MVKKQPKWLNISLLKDVLWLYKPLELEHMEDKLVKATTYERIEEAMLDQQILSENNISSSINNSTSAEILPMLYELDEGISLLVFEKDIEKSREILKEYHQTDSIL